MGAMRFVRVWTLAVMMACAACVRGYPVPTGQPTVVELARVAVHPVDFDERYVSVLGTLSGETSTGCEFGTVGLVLATPEPSIVYLVGCFPVAGATQVAAMPAGTHLRIDGTARPVFTRFGYRAYVYVTRAGVEP